jgi:hypothetical protein
VVETLGVEEVATAASSPWQTRTRKGSRRDCLERVILLDEVHLRRVLAKYFAYYNATRCHLSLAGDAPEPRAV